MSVETDVDEGETDVLVAVGPGGVGDGTLDFAAAEAMRRGTGVELLHVVHTRVAVPAAGNQVANVDRALTEVGRAALTDAATRMRARLGEAGAVHPEIVLGHVAGSIVERGAEMALVVVERREPGLLERLRTSSVTSGVAAHASVPVVVVPPHWRPVPEDPRPVTVGIDSPDQAGMEAPAALSYAESLGVPCVALHAAWVPEAYQNTLFVDHPRGRWVDEAQAALRTALDGVRAAHPDADLKDVVRWARPVDTLVDATRSSQVLVLARRASEHRMEPHLGAITRAVLHHAECPVIVVDRVAERPTLVR